MRRRLITFTNLFPSAAFPAHGLFVQERMRRVVAATGLPWTVICPVPRVPKVVRSGDYARYATMPEREQVGGVEVWHPPYLHLPGFSTAQQAKRMARAARPVLRRLVDEADQCLLDIHYVYPDGIAGLMLAREMGIPAIVTARGSDLNVLAGVPAVARQIRRHAPNAFALLAVSEPLRRRFVEAAQVPDDAVTLVRNGVDLDRFAPGDRAAARAELDLPADGHLVLGVGRLVEAKGFHHAVDLLKAIPDTRLVLIGNGPERARLEAAAPADRLVCLGAQPPERVAIAYQACDVLVLPSEREGWPNVVTEALGSGLPVVATAVGSVPDMITDPAMGAVIPVGDFEALRREVERVLSREVDREAIRRLASQFSWEEPVSFLTELVEKALS